jgi:hypothetical protein
MRIFAAPAERSTLLPSLLNAMPPWSQENATDSALDRGSEAAQPEMARLHERHGYQHQIVSEHLPG